MNIFILGSDFEVMDIIDTFESFIWTERYNLYGDFELYMNYGKDVFSKIVNGKYFSINESDKVMMIERIHLNSDPENGSHMTISGRSLEAIIAKRVIWEETTLSGNFQEGIKKLLTENIISPTLSARKIENFDFIDSNNNEITSKEINTYFFGENLYESVSALCQTERLGFRILLADKRFRFELYIGKDRSYAQEANPWVIFSPDYDNIETSSFVTDRTNYANACLVMGEESSVEEVTIENENGETETNLITYPQMTVEVTLDESSGLDRQEIFYDGSGVNREVYDEDGESEMLPPDEYASLLSNKGLEELSDYQIETSVEGQVDSSRQFIYNKDFKMGDIVQVVNEYGMEIRSQIVEVICSEDENGYKVIPTFVSLDE